MKRLAGIPNAELKLSALAGFLALAVAYKHLWLSFLLFSVAAAALFALGGKPGEPGADGPAPTPIRRAARIAAPALLILLYQAVLLRYLSMGFGPTFLAGQLAFFLWIIKRYGWMRKPAGSPEAELKLSALAAFPALAVAGQYPALSLLLFLVSAAALFALGGKPGEPDPDGSAPTPLQRTARIAVPAFLILLYQAVLLGYLRAGYALIFLAGQLVFFLWTIKLYGGLRSPAGIPDANLKLSALTAFLALAVAGQYPAASLLLFFVSATAMLALRGKSGMSDMDLKLSALTGFLALAAASQYPALSLPLFFVSAAALLALRGKPGEPVPDDPAPTPLQRAQGMAVPTLLILFYQVELLRNLGESLERSDTRYALIFLAGQLVFFPWISKARARVSANSGLGWAVRIGKTFALLLFSAAGLVFLAFYFQTFGGPKFLYITIIGFAAAALTAGGSVAVPILLFLPWIYLTLFWTADASSVAIWMILTAAAAALFRKARIKTRLLARALLFTVYGAALFSAAWYLWPDFTRGGKLDPGEPVVRLTALEKAASAAAFPRAFWSITEDCDGEKLYLTNVFGRPGIIEMHRATGEIAAHLDIFGATETIVFDCEGGQTFVGEFGGERILAYPGLSLAGEPAVLPVSITRPCRLHHLPGSDLLYVNADHAFARAEPVPWWHVITRDGEQILQVSMAEIEEIIPLPDDAFLTAVHDTIYHFRIDRARGVKELMRTGDLPDKYRLSRRWFFCLRFLHLAFDYERDALFVSDFCTGRVYKASLPGLESEVFARLKPGIRFIAYAPAYGVLAVGNYVNGDYHIIDAFTGETRYSTNLGARVRVTTVSRDGERLYTVSRGGIFELRLDRVAERLEPAAPD